MSELRTETPKTRTGEAPFEQISSVAVSTGSGLGWHKTKLSGVGGVKARSLKPPPPRTINLHAKL